VVAGTDTLYGIALQTDGAFTNSFFSWNFKTGAYLILSNFSQLVASAVTYDPSSHLIYWNTYTGGDQDHGQIYSYSPTTGVATIRASLPTNDLFPGFEFDGGFIKASNGKFYTQLFTDQGGAIYEFNPSNDNVTLCFNTTDVNVMSRNLAPLVLHPNGKLYAGSAHSPSRIIEFNPSTYELKSVKVFSQAEGDYFNENPLILIQSQFGALLIGTTGLGGAYNSGTIFAFDPVTSFFAVVYNATGTVSDGNYFESSPAQVADGSLVGSLFNGGPDEQGTIYRLSGFTIPKDTGVAATVYHLSSSYIFALTLFALFIPRFF
jgi:uncharacterized repeat protein (TIGR03803 family)